MYGEISGKFRTKTAIVSQDLVQLIWNLVCISRMAFSTTGLATTQLVFVFRHGSHLMGWIFKYSYILVIETICEDLVKITRIIVEIWAHLLLWRSLKIAKLRYAYYYSFCVGVDIVLNYHSAKFGNNWKKHGWNIDKTLILFQSQF